MSGASRWRRAGIRGIILSARCRSRPNDARPPVCLARGHTRERGQPLGGWAERRGRGGGQRAAGGQADRGDRRWQAAGSRPAGAQEERSARIFSSFRWGAAAAAGPHARAGKMPQQIPTGSLGPANQHGADCLMISILLSPTTTRMSSSCSSGA